MPISKFLRIKEVGLLVGDVLILYGSLALMLFIRYGTVSEQVPRVHFMPFSILFIVWVLIFYIAGLYDLRSLNRSRAVEEKFWPAITIGVAFAIAFFYLFYFAPGFGIAPKTNLFIFAAIASSALYAWRSLWAVFIETRSGGKHVLLIGGDASTAELKTHLEKNPQLGYAVHAWMRGGLADPALKNMAMLIKEHGINIIVVPQALHEHERAHIIYGYIGSGIEVVDLVHMYEAIFQKIPLRELEDARFASMLGSEHGFYDRIKRILELALALTLSIVLSPLFLLIASSIKISSPGSAFFTQTRVGQHGKNFVLWKFRTMFIGAEKHGPVWSKPGDTRITPLGKFLRASHLDELPQLWNIVRGELSFVGPRPERPEFVATLINDVPFYELRHIVKPGLTGWAQLNYKYGASREDAYEKLQYDLYYIKYRSLWLELGTLIKTVKRFFVNAQ